MATWQLKKQGAFWQGSFTAMASPCEVLVDCDRQADAAKATRIVFEEAQRIEQKWSRYQRGNIIDQINTAQGQPVEVDDETSNMLDFAAELCQLSNGGFDITSGVLRRVWKFDGSDNVPTSNQVVEIMQFVGWQHASWKRPQLKLAAGMELDFGGTGKEYAVDRALGLASAAVDAPMLVNFGGDLAANKSRRDAKPWVVEVDQSCQQIALFNGGVATSGDSERYLLKAGKRYSHCLNAKTGWPVEAAAKSVTVIADSCVEAGMVASLAMLQGAEAEAFIKHQGYKGQVVF